MRPLRVLFLESFFGGSHRAFAEGFAAHSRHDIDLRTLPGQEWRRRQRLAAAAFAEEVRDLARYDAVLATDLLDLADFNAILGVTRPTLLYMHETQCTYPLPKGRSHDDDTVFFDVKNCRLADRVVFNSAVHRDAFLSAITPRLGAAGEIDGAAWLRSIEERSTIVYPGVDVARIRSVASGAAPGDRPADGGPADGRPAGDAPRERSQAREGAATEARPANIVWNHRWEYDKNPPAFFRALDALAGEGLDFTVTLLGENPQVRPKDFESARERLGDRVVHYGYAEDRRTYLDLLASGDIVVSTSNQENFGIAMVEAIAAGCRPVLPKRLSYPEIVPERFHDSCLYTSQRSLLDTLRRAVSASPRPGRDLGPEQMRALQEAMMTYDWSRTAPQLDAVLDEMAGTAAPRHARYRGPDG
jgi:glycosyltransferase involved in cell wall biosynthesis